MSTTGKDHTAIEASLIATIDRMEDKLRKYRLDSSTPKRDKDDSKSQDTATRWSYDLYQNERSPEETSCSFKDHNAQGDATYDRYEPRDNSQYAYASGGARPKVHFANEQQGKEDGDWIRRNMSFGANNHQKGFEQNAQSINENTTLRTNAFRPDRESKIAIKPATYDGSSSWLDYKCHFEACANVNGWDEVKKGLFLALSLRGQAQAVLGDMPSDRGQHYDALVRSLQERFSPPNQTDLYRVQLKERRQKAAETLSELGQAIRRLTNLAYPTAPGEVRETLAKDHFIDALIDSDIRIRIKQSRPANLNEAISLAVELEAYDRVERRERELKGHLRSATVEEQPEAVGRMEGWMKAMENNMKTLAEELKELKTSRQTQNNRWHKNSGKKANTSRQEMICYECDKPGHIWRNCPTLKNRFKPKYGKTGNRANTHQDDKGPKKVPKCLLVSVLQLKNVGCMSMSLSRVRKLKFWWTLGQLLPLFRQDCMTNCLKQSDQACTRSNRPLCLPMVLHCQSEGNQSLTLLLTKRPTTMTLL